MRGSDNNKYWRTTRRCTQNMILQNTVAFRKELDEVRASHIKEYPSTTLAAETLVLGDISQAH